MAKKLDNKALIDQELGKFEDKLTQFQTYLEVNTIIAQVSKQGQIIITEDDHDKLHKEILVQIKMQDAILAWLPLLKSIKEKEEDKVKTRGDVEINGLFNEKGKDT